MIQVKRVLIILYNKIKRWASISLLVKTISDNPARASVKICWLVHIQSQRFYLLCSNGNYKFPLVEMQVFLKLLTQNIAFRQCCFHIFRILKLFRGSIEVRVPRGSVSFLKSLKCIIPFEPYTSVWIFSTSYNLFTGIRNFQI